MRGSQDIARAKRRSGFPTTAERSGERDVLVVLLQRVLGMGRPLDDATRRRAESWFGRDLSDVRIHDSRQAAELAKRLGAEAFTVRGHIFGPPDKLGEMTSEGAGLLAHEITHVVQETDPQLLNQEDDGAPTPTEGGQTPPVGGMWSHESRPLTGLRAERPPQPPALGVAASSPSGGNSRISLQVSQDVLQRSAEEEALASEQVVSRALTGQGEAESQNSGAGTQIDPEEVASRVYRLMLHDLVLERERGAVPG